MDDSFERCHIASWLETAVRHAVAQDARKAVLICWNEEGEMTSTYTDNIEMADIPQAIGHLYVIGLAKDGCRFQPKCPYQRE